MFGGGVAGKQKISSAQSFSSGSAVAGEAIALKKFGGGGAETEKAFSTQSFSSSGAGAAEANS